jgi:hypothetical protein
LTTWVSHGCDARLRELQISNDLWDLTLRASKPCNQLSDTDLASCVDSAPIVRATETPDQRGKTVNIMIRCEGEVTRGSVVFSTDCG